MSYELIPQRRIDEILERLQKNVDAQIEQAHRIASESMLYNVVNYADLPPDCLFSTHFHNPIAFQKEVNDVYSDLIVALQQRLGPNADPVAIWMLANKMLLRFVHDCTQAERQKWQWSINPEPTTPQEQP